MLARHIERGDIERGVRRLLTDKVSGNMTGIWLLIPELLRLGAWDMLRGWGGCTGADDLGDVRVKGNIIVITYYNAPSDKEWRRQYENLPRQLEAEGVPAAVPWL